MMKGYKTWIAAGLW